MKLKNVALASLLVGFSVFGTSALTATSAMADASSDSKIVVIDYQKVIKSSKLYSQTSNQFTQKYKSQGDKLKARNDDLSREDASIMSSKTQLDTDLKQGKVTGDSLKKRENDLNARVKSFQDKVAQFQKDAQAFEQSRQKEEQEQLSRIDASIRKVVADYAAKNGYTLVIDANAAVYAVPAADITDDVIKLVK